MHHGFSCLIFRLETSDGYADSSDRDGVSPTSINHLFSQIDELQRS